MNGASDQARVERKNHATMADVARVAGVSLKSVSRVINNEPHVSAGLREKVEVAVAALDYVPDTAARSLAGARSFTIGVMFDNPSPNYTMKIMAGAYRACMARGYHLRIDNIDSTEATIPLIQQVEAILRHSRSDGFVLTPPLTDNLEVLDLLDSHGVRYVRVAPVSEPGRSPAVHIDDKAAASAVAQRLWDEGHRRFGLVNGPAEHGAASTRRDGFLQRLRELDPDAVVSEAYGGFAFAGGISAGRELIAARHPPTAIFATNDDMAAGVMVACAECQLKVPDQVSIIGFDDSWVAMSVWPYLTTVFQPIETMAEVAVDLLLDRGQEAPPYADRMLDWRIVERASDGPRL